MKKASNMYITNQFATQQKVTQRGKSTIRQ